MYTVEVMPIQRGALKDSLTFFSRQEVPVGAVVSASVRNRMIPSLVVACTDVRDGKLDVKAAGYALKKLGTAAPRQLFTAAFMQAIKDTAHYFVAAEGSALAQLTFAQLLTTPRKLESPPEFMKETLDTRPEVLVLQAEPEDRLQSYRNLVRECFARKRSVMIVAPTLVEVDVLAEGLKRGIEERVIVITSAVGPRELRSRWDHAADHTEPVLLIGTPPVLSFPRTDLDAIIVERESARSYVARTRPNINLRRAAEYVAREYSAKLILADFPVRVETFERLHTGSAEDMSRAQVRSMSTARTEIVDARTTDKKKEERRYFTALQPSTISAIEAARALGERAVVFAARRGIAPLTVCNDCGTPITDPATDTPMVLHKTPDGNVFMSHRSGAVLSAERSCALCGGWNLVTLGIGIDRVEDELKKRIAKADIMLFTKDTAPTHKAALKLIDTFYKTPGAVLLGTERMLPYISQPVELAVVASIDSILSSPAWRAHEHALSILYTLLNRATKSFLIETRKSDSLVMKSVASGSPMEFLRSEIKERRTYGYPPFATFVGLSWSGTELACKTLREHVVEMFSSYDLVGPLPPEAVDRNRYIERAVIRLKSDEWPNADLIVLLKKVPAGITVSIDPDDIV